MHHRLVPALIALPLVLAACTSSPENGEQAASSSAPTIASSSVRVTRNVTYTGVVEPAGISIYQEGTHRLTLEDGRFILLESTVVNLSTYETQTVEVKGSLRPTVEAGGIIMDVQSVIATNTASSEALSSLSTSESLASSSAQSMVASSAASIASFKASVTSLSSAALSSSMASSAAMSSGSDGDAAVEARAEIMAQSDLAPAQWTQKYCTEHIGFCIPIHKSWWFKSFGTTTSYLWHVEASSEDILNLGDGPIRINLLSGTVDSKGAADGDVKAQGGSVTGFKAWTDNRHFEITANAQLEAAIRYMLANLTVLEPSN